MSTVVVNPPSVPLSLDRIAKGMFAGESRRLGTTIKDGRTTRSVDRAWIESRINDVTAQMQSEIESIAWSYGFIIALREYLDELDESDAASDG